MDSFTPPPVHSLDSLATSPSNANDCVVEKWPSLVSYSALLNRASSLRSFLGPHILRSRLFTLLRTFVCIAVFIGVHVQLYGEADEAVIAYETTDCTGTKQQTFSPPHELLSNLEHGGEWRSFRFESGTGSSAKDCLELSAANKDLLKSWTEELTVIGHKLDLHRGVSLIELKAQLAAAGSEGTSTEIFNRMRAAINEAIEKIKQSVLDCFYTHFPADKEYKINLTLANMGEEGVFGGYSPGSNSTANITLFQQAITGNSEQIDAYTLMQNVLLHEVEHHRSNVFYEISDGDSSQYYILYLTSERVVQYNTYYAF